MRPVILPVLAAVLAALLLSGCEPKEPAAVTAEAPAAVVQAETAAETAPGVDADTRTPEEISAKLVGTWRATDDDKSTITVTPDGIWIDDYEMTPPVHETSAWRVFSGGEPPEGSTYAFTPTSNYLEVIGTAGALYYEMGVIAPDGFDMFYTARGNLLAYTRVRQG